MTDTIQPVLASDYDYQLPDHLIARYPLKNRSSSRLLQVNNQEILDKKFHDLVDLLNGGDLLVLNDTKVMKARMYGKKQTGGSIEILVERLLGDETNQAPNQALCHIKASRSPKTGQKLFFADEQIQALVLGRQDNLYILSFNAPILSILERFGQMPIPPYFQRQANDCDDERYQTVFYDTNKTASVAAPTASLHFDEDLLKKIQQKGVNIAFVTLHVGSGTFAPVKTDDLRQHIMHAEYAHLPEQTALLINQTKAKGGRVIAVGTTVTRTLETAYLKRMNNQLVGFSGDTQIFIYPPYQFGVVDCLITNFHLPKSTLLMLVSAFIGKDRIQQAYTHAIAEQYRFFSYGDAMFLERQPKNLPNHN